MQTPRDFSLYGAVDLGARQAAAQRKAQAARPPRPPTRATAAPPPGQASAFVFDVTEQTFNTDVVLRSRTTPVIIDLWAEWCGPCKQLSPVLEKLANEANGAWVLAKIDVDANPRLAQAFQAQSIPMVVAIIGGQMVDAFLGAMPEAQVRQWLAQVLVGRRSARRRSGGAPGEPGDPAGEDRRPSARLPEARDAMEKGDLDTAAGHLGEGAVGRPGDPLAKSWLTQVNLMRRVSGTTRPPPAGTAAAAPRRPRGADPGRRHPDRLRPDRGGLRPPARRDQADLGRCP